MPSNKIIPYPLPSSEGELLSNYNLSQQITSYFFCTLSQWGNNAVTHSNYPFLLQLLLPARHGTHNAKYEKNIRKLKIKDHATDLIHT